MIQFKIIQSGNQIESQSEAATAIPVFFRHDPKYLQMPDHVFHHDSFSCQFAVFSLLLFAQLSAFRFLSRCLRVFVFACQALITAVCQTFDPVIHLQLALLEQFKIVRFPACLSGANNAPRFLVNDYLRLYRVPLALSRIISFLFFFGRSITVSVASTTITSKIFSLICKTFLPGRRKSSHFFKISSILRIIRHTVGSLNPHALSNMELCPIFSPILKRQ